MKFLRNAVNDLFENVNIQLFKYIFFCFNLKIQNYIYLSEKLNSSNV